MLKKIWGVLAAPANKAIDTLQEKFPPNRVVVLLTPTAFVPASVWISGWAATHLPGLPGLTSGEVLGVELAGALAALKLADKWIDGWQMHEQRTARATTPPAAAPVVSVHIDGKQIAATVGKTAAKARKRS
jgi:hypothetical protein